LMPIPMLGLAYRTQLPGNLMKHYMALDRLIFINII